MDNLIVNGRDIKNYNNSLNSDEDAHSSFGSISSVDERDLKLLDKDDIKTQFDAVRKINKFISEKMKNKIDMFEEEERENRFVICKNVYKFLTC